MEKICPICSRPFTPPDKRRKFCGQSCYRTHLSRSCRSRLLDPNSKQRKAVVERMTFRNPGDAALTSARLKGRPFPVPRGGNGRGLTKPQALLLNALGDGWYAEHIVFANGTRADWPLMRVDVAFPTRKIAVECDGQSHNGPKGRRRDEKKDGILQELGWTVYRFKNKEITNDLSSVVNQLQREAL